MNEKIEQRKNVISDLISQLPQLNSEEKIALESLIVDMYIPEIIKIVQQSAIDNGIDFKNDIRNYINGLDSLPWEDQVDIEIEKMFSKNFIGFLINL